MQKIYIVLLISFNSILIGASAQSFEEAKKLLDIENFDEAIEAFQDLVDQQSQNSEYHYWLAKSYGQAAQEVSVFKRSKYAKRMKNGLINAIEYDSNNLLARVDLAMFYLFVPGFMGGSYDKALEQAFEIKKLDPKEGIIVYCEIYKHKKEYDKVELEYLAGIKEFPEDVSLLMQLGYLYEDQDRFNLSMELYEKVISIDKSTMYAYYRIGRMAAMNNVFSDKAIVSLKKYLEHQPIKTNPSLASAHWRLGMVYENIGDEDKARVEYQKALSLEPDHKEARKAFSKL